MNADGDFSNSDESNMLQEFILTDADDGFDNAGDVVSTEGAVAMHAEASPERLFCVDTGANVTVCNVKLQGHQKVKPVRNRGIGTAKTGGMIRVDSLFDLGVFKQLRYCPGSRSNLLGGNAILIAGCWLKLFGSVEFPQCQIIRTVDQEEDFEIDCILKNNLWWITEDQFYDLAFRNGLPKDEFDRRAEESRAYHTDVTAKRGTFYERTDMESQMEDAQNVYEDAKDFLKEGLS